MKEGKKKDDEFIITLSDLYYICTKAKQKIFFGVLGFSTLAFVYAIQQPIKYEAKASFREKTNATAGIDASNLSALLFSSTNNHTNSVSISTMKSRTLLEKVIQKNGLQATIDQRGWKYPRLRRIRDNFVVEYTLLSNALKPALKDPIELLKAKEVQYEGEVPLNLKINFVSEFTFEVYNGKKLVGEGSLDSPFKRDDYYFTLYSDHSQSLESTIFSLNFTPMTQVVKDLAANLNIETDIDDSSLIRINYYNSNRHEASSLVNDLMLSFQNHLKDDQQRVSSEQISYLKSREEEMGTQLREMMEAYGDKVSNDVYTVGFATAETALDFLSKQQLALEEKNSAIDLKLKRLEKAKENSLVYETAYLLEVEQSPIQATIHEIQDLKQQSDSIQLALRNSPIQNQDELRAAFLKQVIDLEEVRNYGDETQTLLVSLEQGTFPPPPEKLFNNPHYLAKEWYEKLLKSRKTQVFEDTKNQYVTYLTNLLRYLQVQEKTIEERLAHQQSLQLDFQGINLYTARELYSKFSNSLSQIETDIAERKFIINQMNQQDFEISSLSNVLKDSVSGRMIEKASQIVLQLSDDRNRSEMERERLRKELAIQGKFLTLHLSQNLQLLELGESLLREKIYSIQSATLELIHQKISVLEKQLTDFVDSRMIGLKQERSLIEQHQQVIRGEMSKLPQKWVAENLIQQHLRMNEHMVEEITKLVESKNISKNLEMVQSAPLDYAYAPLNPRSPKLLFFTILGAILGMFFTISSVVASAIYRGIPVSKENLELASAHVAGTLSRDSDDLSVLRRIASYLSPIKKGTILFLQGKAPNYSQSLGSVLSKQGDKVLMISIDFNEKSEQNNSGLLEYIEGKTNQPKIMTVNGLDTLTSGGYSPYGYELLHSPKFNLLMTDLKTKYDWILTTSSITPDTAEAEGLIPLFDGAIVNVHDEKLQDLTGIIQLATQTESPHRITFVIAP
jgi:tyrosine-protein kinase Etk/Wzc